MSAASPAGCMTPERLAQFDRRAPRYTSFPTAAQFTQAVGEAEAARWLGALDPIDPVSLYIHLPFCKRLCWYCGCNTRAVNRPEVISSYVALLAREVGMVEARTGPLSVSRLHLGGGTPNMLSPGDLKSLFAEIGSRFDLAMATEIAAELDPATLTPEWIDAAAALGLNRASLGVQDLSANVQAAVNRIEPFSVVETAAGRLRNAGVSSLNLDLMYGLPEQGVAEVLSTLDHILTLRPERVAMFGYAHVPWMKPHQKLIDETQLPGTGARLEQSAAAAERLIAAGYQAIGIDHFALPEDGLATAAREGRLRRNFQGYTDDAAASLIGLGASSISATADGFWQNHTPELAWRTSVNDGRLPVARGVALSEDDRIVAAVIERLMCDFEVDLDAVAGHRSEALLSVAAADLADLVRDDLVEIEGSRLIATGQGRRFVRLIAAAFDPYLDPAQLRHARVS